MGPHHPHKILGGCGGTPLIPVLERQTHGIPRLNWLGKITKLSSSEFSKTSSVREQFEGDT